jgi:hypothetical protein
VTSPSVDERVVMYLGEKAAAGIAPFAAAAALTSKRDKIVVQVPLG